MNQDKRTEDFEAEPMATAVEQDGAPGEATAEQPEPAPRGAEAQDERTAGERELEAELAATRERLLRALADTENLRRRSARELEEAHKYAITGFARELLEVADNLSRALDSIPPRAREEIDFVRSLADGVAMTERALLASFERHQIAKVEPELGSRFDHNRHQAMLEVETGDYPQGTIAQVMQPGYVIADRLLRPALVGVAKAPRPQAASDAAGSADGTRDDRAAAAGRPGERLDTTA
jgi:molecular chaperone GrpE